MLTLHYDNPNDLRYFASIVAQELKALESTPEPEYISLKEAMEVLDIKYAALARRIEAAGIKTTWRNGGKAFPRKHLNKLH